MINEAEQKFLRDNCAQSMRSLRRASHIVDRAVDEIAVAASAAQLRLAGLCEVLASLGEAAAYALLDARRRHAVEAGRDRRRWH